MRKHYLIKLFTLALIFVFGGYHSIAQCSQTSTEKSGGSGAFTNGYTGTFETTGTDVKVTYQLSDDFTGLIAPFLFINDLEVGQMTAVAGQTRTWERVHAGQTAGASVNYKAKFIYAGNDVFTTNYSYTVGDICSVDPADDVTLSDLTVGGTTIAGFSAGGTSYNIELAPTDPIPTVVAIPTQGNATAVVTAATSIPGTTTILITSSNMNQSTTVSVNFVVTSPSVAAPTPPVRDPSDVISVFSDAYTDLGGATSLEASWGGPGTVTTVDISGNATRQYENFTFEGIILDPFQDLTGMTHVHYDVWSNSNDIGLSLVHTSLGERLIRTDLTSYTWVSIDIPLSEFTSQNGFQVNDIKELKFDQGSGEKLFIDNIYFYAGELASTPPALSAYCATNTFDNNGTPDSEVILTVKNTSPTTIVVEIESADENAVTELLVQLAGNASASQTNDGTKYTETLTYNASLSTFDLQLLWSKNGIAGQRQLNLTNLPFAANCDLPATLTISATETTSGDVECGNLVVDAGQIYTVATGHTLTALGDLTITGELVISSGASLILANGTITGNVTIKRNTRYADGKYSFVGSPVVADASITGSDLGSTVYWYDETVPYGADGLARWKDASAAQLTAGWGYAQAFQQEIIFVGKPNQGTITVSGLSHTALDENHDEHGWSLLSNPYPAAIDLSKFLENADNAALLNGAVYLWDDHGSEGGRGDNGDYITANGVGNVGGPNGGSFNNYIGSTQGFFVKIAAPNDNASVTFTEGMRVGGVNGDANFFREVETDLLNVRLSIESASGFYNELLVGFRADATIGIDRSYDADKLIADQDLQFYSLIESNRYAIQGLPLEAGVSTELAFNLGAASQLTLSVQELTGLAEGMNMILNDRVTGLYYNLSEVNNITFTASAGSDQNRFTLTYASAAAVLANTELSQPIYRFFNGELSVNFGSDVKVAGYSLYDLSGKTIISKDLQGQLKNELIIPVNNSGINILRVETSQGTFTRKFLF